MSSMIRVIQVGVGPVGQMLTPFLLERKSLSLVGAVDINPNLIGKDLGEVSKVGRPIGIQIRGSLEEFSKESADVAVVTTTSALSSIMPTLEDAARLGLDVVSTCEELVYPWNTQPELAGRIDRMAKEHDISILGTRVNPGFLMDALAVMATGICRRVRRISIERIQDASIRRIPFQQKIGTGLTVEEFQKRVAEKKLGHVGLTESMHMIAARMGWSLTRTEDKVEPVLAETEIRSGMGPVPAGRARGLVQRGRGWIGEEEVVMLFFRAAVGEKDSHDLIHVEGTPEYRVMIPGGIHGDIATCAITTNSVSFIVDAPPGLRTMVDIPPVSYRP
ncbi:MAG: dihydrodipicolinate reductase [Pseudomonadota bacterium]